MTELANNRRAFFDYEIHDRYEAGLVLTGQEVKSVKTGHISLQGSFVTVSNNELYLTNANIPPYQHAGPLLHYDPTRSRKLLLKKSEIKSLLGKKRVEGLTLVPIRMYTKKRLIKLEFAIAKGKKQHDKRATIAKKEADQKMKRALHDS